MVLAVQSSRVPPRHSSFVIDGPQMREVWIHDWANGPTLLREIGGEPGQWGDDASRTLW